jgi:hypothetical protein
VEPFVVVAEGHERSPKALEQRPAARGGFEEVATIHVRDDLSLPRHARLALKDVALGSRKGGLRFVGRAREVVAARWFSVSCRLYWHSASAFKPFT